MALTASGRRAAINIWNADGWLWLFKLSHADIATQRFALARSNVTSSVEGSSNTYIGLPLEIEPVTDDKGLPRGGLRLSNVSRQVWDVIGNLSSAPQLDIYLTLESAPDTAEANWPSMSVMTVVANMLTVEAEYGDDNRAVEPSPAGRLIPPQFAWVPYVG
ncbi:MAG: hypothetical protein C4583_03090 [Anaerolineaceae bacterium]|nr:MAG: hypothetical protein C4583_03090 [Anaerolineaceae bacterium]